MKPRRIFPFLGTLYALLMVALLSFLGGPALAQAAGPSPSPASTPTMPELSPGSKLVQLGCANCHSNPEIETKGEGLYVPEERVLNSVHEELTCIACHLQTQGVLHKDAEAELTAALNACGKCHEGAMADFEVSTHGKGDPEGKPNCATCHGAHDIVPVEDRSFTLEVANDRCSECHDERGDSYFKYNYHGKESSLGRSDVAVCADCHTGHRVLPSDDPMSTVNDANRTQMCADCHEGGNDNFADVQIHIVADPIPADPKLAAATLYFIVILTATFGLFGWHMILSIKHEWRKNREEVD